MTRSSFAGLSTTRPSGALDSMWGALGRWAASVMSGRLNIGGDFVIPATGHTLLVTDSRASGQSIISLMPLNSSAVVLKSFIYVAARTSGSFTLEWDEFMEGQDLALFEYSVIG